MSDFTIESRVAVPEAVIAREMDGETVLLNLDTGIYFGLDTVATDMWRAIRTSGSLREASAAIEETYDVDPEVLRSDLLRLANEMLAKGLLHPA